MNSERERPQFLRTPAAEAEAKEDRALDSALQDAAQELAASLRRDESQRRHRQMGLAWIPIGVAALVLVIVFFFLPRGLRDAPPATSTPQPPFVPAPSANAELHPGEYLMRLPRGAEWQVSLLALEENRFQLTSIRNLNSEGIYILRGQRLIMEEPEDPRLTEFQWLVMGADQLRLIVDPSAAKTGGNYVGTTMERITND
jgi:hypothetical protein